MTKKPFHAGAMAATEADHRTAAVTGGTGRIALLLHWQCSMHYCNMLCLVMKWQTNTVMRVYECTRYGDRYGGGGGYDRGGYDRYRRY